MQLTVRRSGFDHPQWDLQSLPIGLAHGHRQAWLTQLSDDLETAAMERMERIVDRHPGRHGIRRGCRSTSTCTCSSSMASTRSNRNSPLLPRFRPDPTWTPAPAAHHRHSGRRRMIFSIVASLMLEAGKCSRSRSTICLW